MAIRIGSDIFSAAEKETIRDLTANRTLDKEMQEKTFIVLMFRLIQQQLKNFLQQGWQGVGSLQVHLAQSS